MKIKKVVWQTYGIIARIALATSFARLHLGKRTLGQRWNDLARRVLKNSLPNPVFVRGHYMYWDSTSYNAVVGYALGDYERDTRLLLQKTLHSGMVVIDLGANIGYFSFLAGKQVGPKGKVYAFEPDPRNYNILIKNIHANSYDNIIIPMQKIISGPKQSPYLNLFLPQDGQGSSIYNRQSFNIHSESAIVETVTLDAFLQKEGWPQVNVIKMDIEGSEKFALEGMKQVVDRNQDLKLIMEFGPNMLFDAGIVPDELFHILIELGFNKYWVIKKDLQPINIPTDISLLVEMADNDYINLFCEIK